VFRLALSLFEVHPSPAYPNVADRSLQPTSFPSAATLSLVTSQLLTLNRVEGDELNMTHALIANMLGVHREGITQAAFKLEQEGVIRSKRCLIKAVDRGGLDFALASAMEL
jgi:hypothetical protein